MSLDEWRSRINNLDNQILDLLTQRAEAALHIGDLKRRSGLSAYAPEREAEVMRRLESADGARLPRESIRAIWREIMSGCRALEAPMTVAFLGPQATFTHQAALAHFGASVEFRPCRTIADIFEEVERARADWGVVPVENTTEGAVNMTLDRLMTTDAIIAGELRLDISQQLLSRAEDLAGVKRVLSHPQGIAQCRGWLGANLPDAVLEDYPSTAGAVEVAAGDSTVAGIASELAGRLYGVPVLRANIEDQPGNSTRFLVIGRRHAAPTTRDKTSIVFAMRNEPGSLHRILEPMARLGINMTKIESRPARQQPWQYVMFVDFEGHRDVAPAATALAEIGERALFLKVLGSYPAA
jgi:chorismate mutase / prephenate dehydratase